MRRGGGLTTKKARRKRVGRLAALAVVSAVLLLPGPSGAHAGAVDDSQPLVSYSIDGTVGTNGWYRGSANGNFVVVHWSASDPESTIISTTGCDPAIQIA